MVTIKVEQSPDIANLVAQLGVNGSSLLRVLGSCGECIATKIGNDSIQQKVKEGVKAQIMGQPYLHPTTSRDGPNTLPAYLVQIDVGGDKFDCIAYKDERVIISRWNSPNNGVYKAGVREALEDQWDSLIEQYS